MRKKKSAEIPKDIREVQARIEEWRQVRPRSRAMPEELWQAATKLAEKYSVTQVSGVLKLNYTKLKQLATPTSESEQACGLVVRDAGFVEFPPTSFFGMSQATENVLEMVSADGAVVTVRTHQSLDLVALVHSFWSRG